MHEHQTHSNNEQQAHTAEEQRAYCFEKQQTTLLRGSRHTLSVSSKHAPKVERHGTNLRHFRRQWSTACHLLSLRRQGAWLHLRSHQHPQCPSCPSASACKRRTSFKPQSRLVLGRIAMQIPHILLDSAVFIIRLYRQLESSLQGKVPSKCTITPRNRGPFEVKGWLYVRSRLQRCTHAPNLPRLILVSISQCFDT